MNAKRQKLMDQFDRDAATSSSVEKKSNIFEGICIFVNGFTSPPAAELRASMMEHGGVFHTYFVKDLTTHIIVSTMANSKQKMFDKHRCVSADWITQSIQAGRLLDWRQYQFKSGVVKGQKPAADYFTSKNSATEVPLKDEILPSELGSVKSEDECEDMMVDGDSFEEETDGRMEDEPMEGKENALKPLSNSAGTLSNSKSGISINNTIGNNNSINVPNGNSFTTIGRPQDPNFLTEFFKNSRLHHISQLGAEWKEYVRKLQEDAETRQFPGREKLKAMSVGVNNPSHAVTQERVIMHIDMDCFFVSVGLRSRPDLRGKPVAVTHSRSSGTVKPRAGTDVGLEKQHYEKKRDKPLKTAENYDRDENTPYDVRVLNDPSLAEMSTSEIASCSYEARAAGVKNGTFLGGAKRLCPSLITIPYDFEGYRQVSKILYDTIASYTCRIESVSCDECFVDLTNLVEDSRLDALAIASVIREDIRAQTQCPASTGLGPNLLVARLATRLAKPDGQHRVLKADTEEFIRQQPVGDLPGVGRAMASKLTKMRVVTCGDLQGKPLSLLQKEFGVKQGASLHKLCRGEDDRPIDACKVRKSVSVDVNYGIRFEKESEPFDFLDKLALEVESRMKSLGIKGKMISLKVLVRSKNAPIEPAKYGGHGIVDHLHKSVSLSHFTNESSTVARECHQMLKTMNNLEGNAVLARDIRGIGVTLTKLDNQQANPVSGQRDISSFIRAASSSSCNGVTSSKPALSSSPAETSVRCKDKVDSKFATDKRIHSESNVTSRKTLDDNVVSLITLPKVKPLIKEWLKSGSEPREEDVDFACALLLSCIYDHDALECVFYVCKMLLRKMNEAGVSPRWRAALDAVIQVVQDTVEEECGHPFLLD